MKEIPTTLAQALSQRKIKLFIAADENWVTQFSCVNYKTAFSLADIAVLCGFDCWEEFIANCSFEQLEKAMNVRYHEMANEWVSEHGKSAKKEKTFGYVYLMENKRNGYTKIGFSKNPKHREKTLQSEEPEVEIIFKAKATLDDEGFLHEQYCSKRIRGEWFDLSDDDKNSIIKKLKGE